MYDALHSCGSRLESVSTSCQIQKNRVPRDASLTLLELIYKTYKTHKKTMGKPIGKPWENGDLPSGKRLHSYGLNPLLFNGKTH